jgi:DNA-binding MarR family transcriptional regulator
MPVATARPDAAVTEAAAALDRAYSWLRRAYRPSGWSAAALSTLDAVDRLGPQRVTDLVARERITQPGMTSLVSRLADAGLVERRQDPSDGRATLVAITAAGREHLQSLRQRRAEVLAERIACLPAGERRTLTAAAAALQALSELPPTPEGLT